MLRLAGLLFVCAAVAAPARSQPAPLQPPPGAVVAYSVSLAAKGAGAILTLELSEAIEHEASALVQPDRLTIDLPRVVFAASQRPSARAGPVNAFRYGLLFIDRSRIVMDLSEPALVEKVETAMADGRHRIQFHIAKVDRAKFSEAAAGAAARRAAQLAAPREAPAQPATPGEGRALPLVVIDPGHGGVDSGAAPRGVEPEKTLVLALAQALEERLKKGGKVQVAMTRTTDVFVSLGDRVRFARERKAALFLSIHADTLAYEPGVRGASVYTLSERASDVLSQRLAEAENKADQAAGVESREDVEAVGDILFDLAKRETRHFSQIFARQLVSSLQSSTSVHKNPLRSAGFRVLKAHDVPSVLIEAGYLSSAEDARLMKTQEWRNQMAEAIALAVERYLGENATGQTNVAPRP